MSWLFLPELVEACSEASYSDGKQCVISNGSHTVSKFSKQESEMVCLTRHQSGMILEVSQSETTTADGLSEKSAKFAIASWLRQVSHVNRFQLQESKEQKATPEICGQIPSESFARYDRDTRFWRMSQLCLPALMGISDEYSETWPRAGIMLDGELYRQPMWEYPISERGFGYWPTPAKQPPGWKNIEVVDKWGNHPQHANQRFYDRNTGRVVQKGLEQVAKMWPTPRAEKVGGYSSQRFKPTLEQVANGGQPTQQTPKMHLNPRWVEWLMGFPIGFSGLEPLEMHRFQQWWQQHGSC